MDTLEIGSLMPQDWSLYRQLRLKAIESDPEAFGMNYETALKIEDQEWEARLQRVAESNGYFMVFAKQNSKLVGMVSGQLLNNPDKGDMGDTIKVNEVFVAEEVRGQGVGKKLFLELIGQVKKNPEYKKLLIKVFTVQIAAINLYKSIGAEIKKEITEKWPDGRTEQTLVMEKTLQ